MADLNLAQLGIVDSESTIDSFINGDVVEPVVGANEPTALDENGEEIHGLIPKEERDAQVQDTAIDKVINGEAETEQEVEATKVVEDEPEESRAKSLYSWLISNNLLPESEEEAPETEEALRDRFDKVGEQRAKEHLNSILSQHGEDRIQLFNALIVDGVDPREYLNTLSEVLDLQSVDLQDEETQEQIIRESYRRIGISADKVEARITKLRERGGLEDEAEIQYNLILKQDQDSLVQQQQKAAQESTRKAQEAEQYRNSITKVINDKVKGKTFNGIPATDKVKQTALSDLTKYSYRLPDGTLITELEKFLIYDLKKPENYETLATIAFLKANNFDLSKIKQLAVSEKNSALFDKLATKKTDKQTINTKPKSGIASWFGQ